MFILFIVLNRAMNEKFQSCFSLSFAGLWKCTLLKKSQKFFSLCHISTRMFTAFIRVLMNHVKKGAFVFPPFLQRPFSTFFFTLLNDDEVSSFCLDKPFVLAQIANCGRKNGFVLRCLDGAYKPLEPVYNKTWEPFVVFDRFSKVDTLLSKVWRLTSNLHSCFQRWPDFFDIGSKRADFEPF